KRRPRRKQRRRSRLGQSLSPNRLKPFVQASKARPYPSRRSSSRRPLSVPELSELRSFSIPSFLWGKLVNCPTDVSYLHLWHPPHDNAVHNEETFTAV